MEKKLLDFYKGMDISFLPECEDSGMHVYDFDGTQMEAFDLIKKYGVNAIRLRLWNDPASVPEAKGYCDLAHTIAMAKRAKKHDMRFLLDFHYSDYWADPAQQRKPKAWEALLREELEENVFSYTKEVLLKMKAEGVLPDMVQIGNEIRSGLLFPEGELPDYAGMVRLVNAGIRGARSVAEPEELQVMIHLDQGGRYFYLKEWFEKAFENGLDDFDIIGLSYYPFWHGTFSDLRETVSKLTEEYQKPVMLVETAHAWRKSEHGFIDEEQERIAGFPATPAGQRQVLDLVMNIMAALPENRGLGIYYWEPLCVPKDGAGGWSENMGILNENGQVLESIRAFEFERSHRRLQECAKVYEPSMMTVPTGKEPFLPEKLSALFYDGSMQMLPVRWLLDELEPAWYEKSGKVEIRGVAEGRSVYLPVRLIDNSYCDENLLRDVNWDNGLVEWQMKKSDKQVIVQLHPLFERPFPEPPCNALRVEGKRNFTFSIYQENNVAKGRYCLTAELMGTDTTNVKVCLFAMSVDGKKTRLIHLQEHKWETYEVSGIECTDGCLTIGVEIEASPMYCMIRNFVLKREA